MKLKEFNGTGIRGYQEHHIQFRENLTFLIGINGSGKTTVLNLIQGLLKPSYRILDEIEFNEIDIEFEIESTNSIIVSCKKTKETIIISHIANGNIISCSASRVFEKKDDIDDAENNEIYRQICESFENHPVCKEIASYKSPMFLTLERIPHNIRRSVPINRFIHPRRLFDKRRSIDSCLYTIQDAIYEMMRVNSSKQNAYIVNLRNAIVKKSLSFMVDDFERLDYPTIRVDDITTIQKREQDFMDVMDGLDIPGITEIASDFFEKIKDATNKVVSGSIKKISKQEKVEAIRKLVYSQVQIKRLEEISKLGHEYQDKVAKLQEPMNRFMHCVNMFFEECNKSFRIDKTGKMKVICSTGISKHINDVTELSSGEKQIVAMLGSLIFLHDDSNPEVYFIDEPEVSLHLSWQDIFVDALLKACPQYQFVLATHSPNIIAKDERQSWCEDLSPKFLRNEVR